MAFSGMFTPVLAKHSKSFPLIDCISVGVDRMQRNFEPMRKRVEAWKKNELTGVDREGGHLRSFRGRQTGNVKARCPTVHDLYFDRRNPGRGPSGPAATDSLTLLFMKAVCIFL